jgi:hypothetical protein
MDDVRFDALTRAVAAPSRRGFFRLLGGGLAAAVGLGVAREPAAAQSCSRWVLSGGRKKTEPIEVDDRIIIYLNGDLIYSDRNDRSEIYPPFRFRARRGDRLRIVARDEQSPCYKMDPLYLQCASNGDPRRLTPGVIEVCGQSAPKGKFFDETFRI